MAKAEKPKVAYSKNRQDDCGEIYTIHSLETGQRKTAVELEWEAGDPKTCGLMIDGVIIDIDRPGTLLTLAGNLKAITEHPKFALSMKKAKVSAKP